MLYLPHIGLVLPCLIKNTVCAVTKENKAFGAGMVATYTLSYQVNKNHPAEGYLIRKKPFLIFSEISRRGLFLFLAGISALYPGSTVCRT